VKQFGFNSRYKLKKTDDFSSVFSFRKRISGALLIVQYKPNSVGYPRLGMVLAKKVTRSAAQRNYMRRVLRELFRCNRHLLEAVDLVIRPQATFGHPEFQQIKTEFEITLQRLNRRLDQNQSSA